MRSHLVVDIGPRVPFYAAEMTDDSIMAFDQVALPILQVGISQMISEEDYAIFGAGRVIADNGFKIERDTKAHIQRAYLTTDVEKQDIGWWVDADMAKTHWWPMRLLVWLRLVKHPQVWNPVNVVVVRTFGWFIKVGEQGEIYVQMTRDGRVIDRSALTSAIETAYPRSRATTP